jgi:hypothetical protein
MGNRRILLTIIIAALFPALCSAGTTSSGQFSPTFRRISGTDYRNCIGYTSGESRGFTYRRWISDKNALQITVNPFFVKNLTPEQPLHSISFTPAALINIAKFNYFRFLAYGSGTYACIKADDYDDQFFWIGVGGGVEYYIWRFGCMMTAGVSTADDLSFSSVFGVFFRF